MNVNVVSTIFILTYIGIRALETEIAKYILSLGRIPIAWQEALLNTGIVSYFVTFTSSNGLLYLQNVPGMVFQGWKSFDATGRIIEKHFDRWG